MTEYKWELPKRISEVINDDNMESLSEREYQNKVCIIVERSNPFSIVGTILPKIEKDKNGFHLSGECKIIKQHIPIDKTRVRRHILLSFFNANNYSVELGYSNPEMKIQEGILNKSMIKYFKYEDLRDNLILLDKLVKDGGKVIQKGVQFKNKSILPFHQLMNEGMTVYSTIDSDIGNFIKEMSICEDYLVAVRFSRDILHYNDYPIFKKAFWDAPTLKSFENLNETPVAYRYDKFSDQVLGVFCPSYNRDHPLNRIEIYWKKINQSEWQVEIERIVFKELEDHADKFGMKYFHGVYNRVLEGFLHSDASVRVYNRVSFEQRYYDTKSDIKTFGKNQEKIKVVRIDVDMGHLNTCDNSRKTNHRGRTIQINDVLKFAYLWFDHDPLLARYFSNISKLDPEM